MSTSERLKRPLLALLACVAALAAFDRALGWYGARHFLPQQQLRGALAAGDGCLLTLGDSRMVAGIDVPALQQALRGQGLGRCVAPLAIGATDVSGMAIAARAYIAAGRAPAVALLGKVEDSFIDPETTGPEAMTGNNAIHLVWSRPGDVFDEIPGFPFASVRAFDDGLRFLVARATALGRYQSTVSLRVQQLQDRATGRGREPANAFGAVGDMDLLADRFRVRAVARLDQAVRSERPEAMHRRILALLDLLRSHGVRIVVVELPMPSRYRDQVSATPAAGAYRQWFGAMLAARGGSLVDLSRTPWLTDAGFADSLHLTRASAVRLSGDLGAVVAGAVAPNKR